MRETTELSPDAPAIALRNVSKCYDHSPALRTTDLHIARGATTVLVGPSGGGKSTLLRLMIGLVWPDTGAVEIDGQPLTTANLAPIRHRMGYVIQEGGLFPHLSAANNVTLLARHLRHPKEFLARRLDELTELTRFPAAALQRFPGQLSGGQRQRVNLMRALMLDPAVLLLDEPLGALDPVTRADLQTDLRRIFQARRKTVVLVTHDMGEAVFLADTIIMVRDGQIVQTATPKQLLACPADAFVAQFINAQRSPLAALGASTP